MTEHEWLASTDVLTMYRLLRESSTLMKTRWQGWIPVRRFRFSPRKEMLFRCAVCERLLEIVESDAARRVLETRRQAQFLPETPASFRDPSEALHAFLIEARQAHPRERGEAWSALDALTGDERHSQGDWLFSAAAARADFETPHGDLWQRSRVFNTERARQVELLREFAGNPFQVPRLPDDWPTWNAGLIGEMARRIDVNEDLGAMPVLGDALEDAGCTDAYLLQHCRQAEPYRRGCWVLDLVLGREGP